MNINSLSNNILYSHSGIQRCVRVLENNLHFPSIGKHILLDFLFRIKDDISAISDTSAGRLCQTKDRTACCSFAAAGLSYQTKGFSLIDKEGNIIHSLNHLIASCHRKILL